MQIPAALDPFVSLQETMPNIVFEKHEFRGETTILVSPENVISVLRHLRDTKGLIFNYLSDISAVDYYPENSRPERFAVSFHLYSMLYARRIRVKVFVPEDEPSLPTSTGLFPAANWLEREIMDMMGIVFTGHPDPRRVLMPQDWNGHPHRRDYPLGYETVMFSFNVEEISKHKPFAKE